MGGEVQEGGFGLLTLEDATANVTQHGDTVDQPRFLGFGESVTVRLPGTGPWAGYNESSYDHVEDVGFDGFMRYFADDGSGLVIELENMTTYTAEPAKLFKSGSKVALAVFREIEMKITISSANVLSIAMDREMAEDNFVWFATEDGTFGSALISSYGSNQMGPNQCLDITTTTEVPTSNPTSRPTSSPNSSPTQPSGAVARRSGFPTTAFATLVAAALVALW